MFLRRRLAEAVFSRPKLPFSDRFPGFSASGIAVTTSPIFGRDKKIRKFIFPFCWFSWFRGAGRRRTLKSGQMGKPQMGKPR